MKPIILVFKNYRVNPLTNRGNGELMVVHQCLSCGKLSPNRIAGDDNEYQILRILKESLHLDVQFINQLKNQDLELITTESMEEALISLFGVNYQNYLEYINDLL